MRSLRPPAFAEGLRHIWMVLACLGIAVTGCGNPAAIQPDDIRSYTAPAPPKPRGQRPPPPVEASLQISYDTPPGWTDVGGSGMRLATLVINENDTPHEVTIIPAAGTLEANVARWLGQLDPAMPSEAVTEATVEALKAADRVSVGDTEATLVTLGDTEADEGDVILAAAIPLDDTASLFVKFKGPSAIARRERDAFETFVSSVRWKEETPE